MSKINIDDPDAWSKLNWDEPIVPEILKRTDQQVNIARGNKIKGEYAKATGKFKGENNPRFGETVTDSTRQKIGQKNLGHTHTEESKLKMGHPGALNGMYGVRLTGELNGFFQQNHTDASKEQQRISALNREQDHHCEHCDGNFTAQAYKQHHGEHCAQNPNRIVKERKLMDKQICPHCGTPAAYKAFARLHGDNCKKKAKT